MQPPACAACVNRISWDETGSMLASGSDDTTVCVFGTALGEQRVRFSTGHRQNIFGVKFLPNTGGQARQQAMRCR
ncbi:unnamed protein product [Discosporangium mesarthrocarpum]